MSLEINLGFAFAIFFVTLGPLKIIPPFFFATHGMTRNEKLGIAVKSTLLSAIILVATAFVALSLLTNWRVSREPLLVAGGLLLLVGSLRMLNHGVTTTPPAPEPEHAGAPKTSPLISPITIPATITPWGLVALILFTSVAEDQHRLAGVFIVLGIVLVLNLVAMLLSGPFMRFVGVPALGVIGWIFAILQAALGMTFLLRGVTAVFDVPWVGTPI
jgi:multiple antibiotic resistance protein